MSSGRLACSRTWSKGSEICPISSRKRATAKSKSSGLSMRKPRRLPDDLIGLTKNGKASPASPILRSGASSKGSKAVKAGMWSGTASRWTTRNQYLCSHLSRLSSEVEIVPYFRHRIGSMVDTGKSA